MNIWRHINGNGSSRSVAHGGLTKGSHEFVLFKEDVNWISLLFEEGAFYAKHHTKTHDLVWIRSFSVESGSMKLRWEVSDSNVKDSTVIRLEGGFIYKDKMVFDKATGQVKLDLNDRFGPENIELNFMHKTDFYRRIDGNRPELGCIKYNVETGAQEEVPLELSHYIVRIDDLVVGMSSNGLAAYNLNSNSLLWKFPLVELCENLNLVRFAAADGILFAIVDEWLLKIDLQSGKQMSAVKYTDLPALIDPMKQHTRAPHYRANQLVFDGRHIILSKLNLWGYLLCLRADDLQPVWCLPSRDIGYSCIAGNYVFTTDDRRHKCLNVTTAECLSQSKKTSFSNMVMASDDYVIFFNHEGNAEFYKFQK